MPSPTRYGIWSSKAISRSARASFTTLTLVDDHSRYAVVLHATDNERDQTVQNAEQAAFERYGLPVIILTDNGSHLGSIAEQTLTKFGVWLIEHGVAPWHSPPLHP